MKKVIVLSAVVMAATFSLTSCGDKTAKTEVTETEITEAPVDTVAQPEADTTAVVTDTVVEKK